MPEYRLLCALYIKLFLHIIIDNKNNDNKFITEKNKYDKHQRILDKNICVLSVFFNFRFCFALLQVFFINIY